MRPTSSFFLIYGVKMKLHLKVIATASVVVVLAACGGGGGASNAGPDVTVPEATGISQDTGLAPNPNGFAFPNFGSAGSPEVFSETDLVSMFGATPDICVDGVTDPCNPTAEAAAWARMVNQARASGHCEG
jgi:ABC-type glycerol-3-phosphate transport system substrate-binding protein